ncbi:MAG: hypothetical protein JWP81_4501 [Ferruginibacter sp.]|nr:hypothetical protein [Ferruginibacter sp.]
MLNRTIECPVDFVLINERKARLTAAGIFILIITYLLTQFWIIPVFLVVDFLARGFNLGSFSVLNKLSERLIRLFSIGLKPVDQAPKRFAAKIGLIFSIAIVVNHLFNFINASLILAVVLAVFALLEAAFGFCAGCHVYSFYTKFLKKKGSAFTAILIVAGSLFLQQAMAQPTKSESNFTIENYYKTRWGFADEFITLWKANHYPLLKKAIEKKAILSLYLQKNQCCTAVKTAGGILK